VTDTSDRSWRLPTCALWPEADGAVAVVWRFRSDDTAHQRPARAQCRRRRGRPRTERLRELYAGSADAGEVGPCAADPGGNGGGCPTLTGAGSSPVIDDWRASSRLRAWGRCYAPARRLRARGQCDRKTVSRRGRRLLPVPAVRRLAGDRRCRAADRPAVVCLEARHRRAQGSGRARLRPQLARRTLLARLGAAARKMMASGRDSRDTLARGWRSPRRPLAGFHGPRPRGDRPVS
jgi:hypothetical protein